MNNAATTLSDFDKLTDFSNLYKAHRKAKRSKNNKIEVISFEMQLAFNLTRLREQLLNGTYRISGYYSFYVFEPKKRLIHALYYQDRVVQHCLCDEILAPVIDKKLIYDNCACRIGKGLHFSLDRLTYFLRKFYSKYQNNGYFLKCDIKKFFDSIDHDVLKEKLKRLNLDNKVLKILHDIIDSYEVAPNKGLPMGNQTSQWFAIYYLDSMDRFLKEAMGFKYYTRYMDDFLIIHHDKSYLQTALALLKNKLSQDEKLLLNSKTQIIPIKNGVTFLGFRIILTETGKILKYVKRQTKTRFKNKFKFLSKNYTERKMSYEDVRQVVMSYKGYLLYGNCYKLFSKYLNKLILTRH